MRPRARLLVIDQDPSTYSEFRRLLEPIWPEEPSWQAPDDAAAMSSAEPDPDLLLRTRSFPILDLEFAPNCAEGLEVMRLSLAQEQGMAVAFVGLAAPCWEEISVVERLWQIQPDLPIVLCVAFNNLDWAGIIPHLGRSDRLLILQKPIDNLELRQLAYSLIARTQAEQALVRTRDKLMQCSRLAGMAQIATSVLHNVGNALTSVNISTSVIADHLARSQAGHLLELADLLPQDPDELARFIATDPRGRLVPKYLSELARTIAGEHGAIAGELECVVRGIHQIKHIVARQQDHARVKPLVEAVDLPSLIDEALRAQLEPMAAAGVEIIRQFQDVPAVTVDKHKTLHILINLINNAADAMQAVARSDKRLVLRLTSSQPGFVQVSVNDNGMGIAPEDRSRIFQFGFTTKKDGHGFGLHGSANDAFEMGGSLQVHSDGPGTGATFTLELPVWSVSANATPYGRPALAP